MYSIFLHIYSPPLVQTYRGYGVDHTVGDLILSHVLHHIKLSCSLLGDDLVSDFLQFRVELLKEIFKQQRQKLESTWKEKPSIGKLLINMIHVSNLDEHHFRDTAVALTLRCPSGQSGVHHQY